MTAGLRFTVLGPLRAWHGETELNLGTPQQQATLAVLLLREGRLIPADELVTAVWGDELPVAAIATMRTYISRLRRVFTAAGTDPALTIESRAGGYWLPLPADALDLQAFRRAIEQARSARELGDLVTAEAELARAVSLSADDLLNGLTCPYIDAERAATEQARLSARTEHLDIRIELGDHDEAICELIALVQEHPFRERLHELLMVALYRSGRQAEALSVYENVRRLLTDELGVEPGPALQDLHRDILRQEAELTVPTGAAVNPTPPVAARPPESRVTVTGPQQLPADLADFTGRETLVADLTEALVQDESVPVVAITGLGGVGKTALAVRVAHRLKPHFPDGQMFVALGSRNGQPATPFTVLAGLLKAFRVSDGSLPTTLAGRSALWRTVLAGRRVLLVLDDVADYTQVRELLPAMPGCAAVLTARQRILDLPGAQWISLDLLHPDEAVTLLGRIADPDRVAAEPEAAERLATCCFYLPHALRLIGARLNCRPHWSLAELADLITEGMRSQALSSPDLVAMTEPLIRAYHRLEPLQARAFRLLAGADDPDLRIATAVRVLDLPPELTETVLESLADLHLIQAGRRGEYRWPEMVRQFARSRLVTDDQTTTMPISVRARRASIVA